MSNKQRVKKSGSIWRIDIECKLGKCVVHEHELKGYELFMHKHPQLATLLINEMIIISLLLILGFYLYVS